MESTLSDNFKLSDKLSDTKEGNLKLSDDSKSPDNGQLENLAFLPFKLLETQSLKLPKINKKSPQKPSSIQRFEIGYENSFLSLEMPVNRTFEQQRVISETLQSNRISTNAHGVNFAYSFKRNWWF
ncbi:MAG: hypothetical protein P1U70_21210 [Saprospiraceae bacterium]|nr:hypothetical protein [Saprospiraceae bacterium]